MEVVGVVAVDVIGAIGILSGNGVVSKVVGLKDSDVTLGTEVAYICIKL